MIKSSIASRLFALAFLFLFVLVTSSSAASYVVTKTADSNDGVCNADCSLREAIEKANQTGAADVVSFDPTVFANPTTIDLFLGEIVLGTNLTIVGPGARLLEVRQSTPGERIFSTIQAPTTGVLSSFRISGGHSGTTGGAILLTSSSNWILEEIAFVGNSAPSGGAIYNEGALTILNSFFEFNNATGTGGCLDLALGTVNIANTTFSACEASGGGAINISSGTMVLNNVTIASSTGNGGGIRAIGSSTVRMRNTLVSDNNCIACGNDESDDVVGVGRFVSNGNNLIKATPAAGTGFADGVLGDKVGVDPQLFDGANNGGVVNTITFLPTSPALDAGNNCVVDLSCPADNPSAALSTDARGAGFPRLSGLSVDIGAYELIVPTAAPVLISGQVVDSFGRAISGATVSAQSSDGSSATARTNPFGYFSLEGFDAGQTVILQVSAKRYVFDTRLLVLEDNVSDLLFVGTPR